jgi:hypothetical protein
MFNGDRKNWRKSRQDREKRINGDVKNVMRAISEIGSGKQKRTKLSFRQRELMRAAFGSPVIPERAQDEAEQFALMQSRMRIAGIQGREELERRPRGLGFYRSRW